MKLESKIGEKADPSQQSVSSYPVWKRGAAILWVLLMCTIAGAFGLFAAGILTMSGY